MFADNHSGQIRYFLSATTRPAECWPSYEAAHIILCYRAKLRLHVNVFFSDVLQIFSPCFVIPSWLCSALLVTAIVGVGPKEAVDGFSFSNSGVRGGGSVDVYVFCHTLGIRSSQQGWQGPSGRWSWMGSVVYIPATKTDLSRFRQKVERTRRMRRVECFCIATSAVGL